jgi:4-alpha-glucanotransferase
VKQPPAAPGGRPLREAARSRGVAPSYIDAWGRRRWTSGETLSAVLAALGEERQPSVEVVVAWDGALPASLPRRLTQPDVVLELETGGEVAPAAPAAEALPPGIHSLVSDPSGAAEVVGRVISAPRRGRPLAAGSWGVFAPTYALSDARRRPRGDLSALEHLGRITADWGGGVVATLPLLALPLTAGAAEAAGAAESPYSPVSRMWWDERVLDLRRLPEVATEAAALPAAIDARSPDAGELLDLGAQRLTEGGGERGAAYRSYLARTPAVTAFGRYRAATGEGGSVARSVYTQWATDTQLGEVAAALARRGCGLLLDLPVGCRPDGFDPLAHPGSFSVGVSIGAPPDRFFVKGQNWGLAPLDPHGERRAGYPVLRASLAHCLRHAKVLRIDHVMSFQRLWWVPEGAAADEGAYVSYPTDELLAVALLEGERAGASLVGEDLGTVTPALRRTLAAHQVAGTDVALFGIESAPTEPLRVRRGSVATVDTHDTATLAGFLEGDDVGLRLRLGLVDAGEATSAAELRRAVRAALERRLLAEGRIAGGGRPGPAEILAALLEELGESEAGLVVATLEDLWCERDPQNVPGTTTEHVNFSRPLARSLEQVENDPTLRAVLERLDRARQRKRSREFGE